MLVNGSTYTKAWHTDTIDFDELPAVVMKGMEHPVPMYRAVGVIDARYYEPDDVGGIGNKEGTRLVSGVSSGVRMVGQERNLSRVRELLERYQQSWPRHGFLCVVRL